MANTIARAVGEDSTRQKETHRLGSKAAWVQAATWRTFVTAEVFADGHGGVTVERDGEVLYRATFAPEESPND